jgi:hypothetical protein
MYVSLKGSDSNSGLLASPFRTLQACVNSQSSVECVMRGGRYDTEKDVTIIKNRGDVTISGMPGDEPAVIDGSVEVNMTWSKHGSNKCVYESEAFSDVSAVPWQMWVTDATGEAKPLTPARWPNAKLSDLSVFSAKSFTYSAKNSSTAKGIIYDGGKTPSTSIAASGIDFTDTLAVLPLGTMGMVLTGATVKDHAAGKNSFKFDPPAGVAGKGHSNLGFFFEGHPKLLDAEEEWSYDTASKKLLLWLPNCGDPNQQQMRGKVRSYSLNASSTASLTIKDLTIFGTAFSSISTGLSLDTVQLLFPTASKRTLGEVSDIASLITTSHKADRGLQITNSTIAWAETGASSETAGATKNAAVFSTVGTNSRFVNNLWHACGYAGGSEATVSDQAGSSGMVYERNTVQYFNTFTCVTPGLRATITRNEFCHQGVAADGASVHVHIGSQNGVLINENWAHDTVVKAFRFDRVNSATATWGENGTITNNIAWRTGDLMIKGDKHTVHHNIVFDANMGGDAADGKPGPGINVLLYDPTKSWAIKGENANTKMHCNGADWIFNVSNKLAGDANLKTSNNTGGAELKGGVRPQLANPDQLDFRPIAGGMFDTENIGPYHSTDKNNSGYWIPGQQLHSASAPVPVHGALIDTNAVRGVDLMLAWREAYQALEHHVHLFSEGDGEGSNTLLLNARTTEGPNTFYPFRSKLGRAILTANASFSWRVDAVHADGSVVEGPLWAFAFSQ